jgi:Na+/melibiose symporter-like transporter
LRHWLHVEELASFRFVILGYALLLLLTAAIYSRLSHAVETPAHVRAPPLSETSRHGLWTISALFGLDSVAGGFLTSSLLSFYFFQRFGAAELTVGLLFFGARVANAMSHLAAAWLAKRIGLVKTMVFTHIPSSILLVTVAFAPNFTVAAVLFLLREGLVEMDVPTRQSYVMAMVRPHERTFASGLTNLVRLGGWALAPSFAGLLMQGASLAAPLFVGAGMKISYDLLLYRAFRRVTPPEEA